MPNAGTAEYLFVNAQAAGRAICPYCQGWHLRDTEESDEGDCEARYLRVRRVAICVRGRPSGLGTGVRVPTAEEKQAAVDHASQTVYQ